MVHDVPSRRKARELMVQAGALVKESKTLAGIDGAEIMIADKENKAIGLREVAGKLALSARLEDLTVREEPLVKQTKKGERTYYRWVASWREGGRCRKVYLGSCRKMSQPEALKKARELKSRVLRIETDTQKIMKQ